MNKEGEEKKVKEERVEEEGVEKEKIKGEKVKERKVEEKNVDEVKGEIRDRVIEQEMKSSYLDYAMSVIVGRALPDVRDGLKPVHRRILFAMHQMGLFHNKPFKKSARVVGEVLGKFHPHGDTAVYDALVRMAQDFSMRYPLVEGQGNFGSIDGDSPAAMRYTEVRLSRIAEEMLVGIEKETVDFVRNFDNTLEEPVFLPSRIPNLLLNGSSGIAVGMATNIPPHNLNEVADAIIHLIHNPEASVNELLNFIKGPDFPTGGIIYGTNGIRKAYTTGRGLITVRARVDFETIRGKQAIVVSEIPFMVNKSELLEEIARLVKEKRIDGITDLRDESDKHGIRIVIMIRNDSNQEIILNQLYKHTKLQTTFGINLLTLVNGKPKTLGLKELIQEFINHRRRVVRKALEFDLKKARLREEIVKGLLTAIMNIDEVVKLIKSSRTVEEAKQGLMNNYEMTENQANAVLNMKLQKLSSLEQEKLKQELEDLKTRIRGIEEKLSDENKILAIIKDEMLELKQKYGDDRRTEIIEEETIDLNIEDLIEDEKVVVLLTNRGYIKRTKLKKYRSQSRGGKGVKAVITKEEDFVKQVIITTNKSYLLFFTNTGRVFRLKAYEIPEYDRNSRGRPIINFLRLNNNEFITEMITLKQEDFVNKYLVFATKQGIVKRTKTEEYYTTRNGIKAIILGENDELVSVGLSDGNSELLIATKYGFAARFKEEEVRVMGRNSRGVIGVRLSKDKVVNGVKVNDEVVDMILINNRTDDKTNSEDIQVLTVTSKGFGKRTRITEYRLTGRGVKGVINIKVNEKVGFVVGVKGIVTNKEDTSKEGKSNDELLVVTKKGITIRTPVDQVSIIGRNTQGVRIIRLDENDEVVDVELIRKVEE